MSRDFAGDRLFEREPSLEEIQAWTASCGLEPKKLEVDFLSVFLFQLGEELLAIETARLHEVEEFRPIHKVPHHTHGALKGLVNLRGQLELCISLGSLLGTQRGLSEGENTESRLVLAGSESGRFAFVVTRALGVQRILRSDLDDFEEGALIYSSFNWEGKMIGLLDTKAVEEALVERLAR